MMAPITNCNKLDAGTSAIELGILCATNAVFIVSRYFFNATLVQYLCGFDMSKTNLLRKSQKSICYNGGVARDAGQVFDIVNGGQMQVVDNDGGRAAAGYQGSTGDCVTRAVCIAAEMPYKEVYAALSEGSRTQRLTCRSKRKASARNGVNVRRKWFRDYMTSLGWKWFPTMKIGSGCKVHLRDGDLPMGRLIVSVSKHYTAVIDGVIHDTHDPSRGGMRCVYGYWAKA